MALSDSLEPAGDARKLTGGEFAWAPTWSADGNEIIYSAGGGDNPRLRRVPSGGGPSEAIAYAADGDQPTVSPSGERMVYARTSLVSDIWQANLPDGSVQMPLVRSTRRDLTQQYSPDGRRIAFSSGRSGYREIWVCDSDGASPIQLTDLKSQNSSTPYWSPDGHEIVFQSVVENQREIFVVRAGGGAPRRLTDHPARDSQPSWSRDGDWIYFSSTRAGASQIWRVPAMGGEPTLVTEGGYAIESQDGRDLYVARGDPGRGVGTSVWKVSKDGKQEVRIIDAMNAQPLNFTVTPEGLFFLPAGPDPDGQWWLWRLAFASGRADPIFRLPGPPSIGLSVAPDGGTILFVLGSRRSDLMLVENFQLRLRFSRAWCWGKRSMPFPKTL